MTDYQRILDKLEQFLSRYYIRQLLKGAFLFVFFGGLLILFVSGLEYLLWMGIGVRTFIFWSLIVLLVFLVVKFLVLPSLKLFRLRKGLSQKEGSALIGQHFPEVGDRLYNLIDLAEQPVQSELLVASIDQRSRQLSGVPFARAVNFTDAVRYGRFALVPIVIITILLIAGKGLDFLESYQRVVNYQMAYEPPAPFEFRVLNKDLRVLENQPFVLKVLTEGPVRPEFVQLIAEGQAFVMEDKGMHQEFTFRPPLQPMSFHLEANGVRSLPYNLDVLWVPVIDRFEMKMQFPAYLGRPDQVVKGTGSITVPEGTQIEWYVRAVHTDTIRYTDSDTTLITLPESDSFNFGRRFFASRDYELSTSNKDLSGFDALKYRIEVIRDEYPRLSVQMARDSLEPNLAFFSGELSDDYGISGLRVLCYRDGDETSVQSLDLLGSQGTFDNFYYTFPSGFELETGAAYIVQFVLTDNDGLRGGKESRSERFRIAQYGEEDLREQQLRFQSSLLKGMGKTRESQEKLKQELDAFNKEQKGERELNFDDQQQLKKVLQQQMQQEQLMEKFSRELSDNLDREQTDDAFKELLQERLERQEIEARKNAALMEEMQKVIDQLDREALQERMDELGKRQEGNRRNLEQLLELTKRYYVQQKIRQLGQQLERLSEEQSVLSERDSIGAKEQLPEESLQRKLNDDFDALRKELGDLEKSNNELRKPLSWKRDEPKENSAASDQEKALNSLQERANGSDQDNRDGGKSSQTRESQKAAARKLSELSAAMQQAASAGGSEANAEDSEMLRQILDNLVVFSFEQERLFETVQQLEDGAPSLSKDIRRQQDLRQMFEHVDDSLFALSLRRPEISETINTQITEVYYNIDRGLGSLSENQWYRGASYQQYVITASNELAAMLASILENMQQSMSPGSGAGEGFQLPDIIQSQEQLRQKMQGSSGESGEEGNQGQQGEQGGEGENGKQGTEGPDGQNGEGGEQGQNGGQGSDGQDGREGQSGQQGQDSKNGQNGSAGGQEGKQGSGEGSGGNTENQGSGTGEGNSQGLEMGYEELFEIYKEQQRIRLALEDQLKDMINNSDRQLAQQIAREMEQFENELLRSGVTERTADRVNRIRQQLMKLENAAFEQGERPERESATNRIEYTNPILTRPEVFENEQETLEILNRQVLPLRRFYKDKIRTYFQDDDRVPLPD